ncbi:MAG: PBP1A family penicillin-binding protein [Candidatus Staskawiczbacteria bacterium]|nr:PBP1A family penicillin-binding protein [Candidatus Staskawiczbacteria bacterium]
MKTNFLKIIKNIKNKFKGNKRDIAITVGKYLAFLFLAGCFLFLLLFLYYTYDLPRPEKFTEARLIQSTKIYDRTGKVLLYDIYGEEKREIVSFEKISDNLKHAVLASEDERFYQHGGIDFRAIIRAVLTDLRLMSKEQGASTITQQLIRSVYLTNQKSIGRKIREVVLSIELEEKYSKDQIFDWYLNQVPFGQNAYGAESASQTYFNKPASDLSMAESAALTAMLPAPSHYSPYGPYKSELLERKNIVLEKMQQLGYITKEELKTAKEEKLDFAEVAMSIKAPDFVLYVKKYLDNKYGEDYLKEKGLRVYTSLDWELQQYAEQIVKDNDEINKAKGSNNSAMVVLDPKTGEILALLGSKDYFAKPYPEGCDEKGPGNCLFDPKYDVATMGQRQPGSSFKPFVYATAFKKGYTPDTMVWDVTTEFNPNCDPSATQNTDVYGLACYHPQDYDGRNRGLVQLKQALGSSLNIPAVKVLYLAGIPDSLKTARAFGITTLTDTSNYGLSLVLGGGDVNLLEMTSAYGVFAAEGNYIPPVSILKIEDSEGNVIEENKPNPLKVLDTQVARQINNILSDNNNRAPLFGYNSPLYLPGYQVAAKTGTTQSFKDGWTMGYTPFAVVGVWTGNNNNTPTKDEGVGIAAPMWNKMMQKIVSAHSAENFTPPNPVFDRSPALMGQLPPEDINTILYYVDKNNPLGQQPQNPASDAQYPLWQIGINNYLIQTGKYADLLKNNENKNDQEGSSENNGFSL